jgi:hypothetical protein
VDYVLARILDPLFMPLHPGERVYWLYLLSGLAFAAAVYLANRRGKTRSLRGLLGYLLPRPVLLHASALLDYRYFVVNRIVFGMLLLPALPAAALGAAAATRAGLQSLFRPFLFLSREPESFSRKPFSRRSHWISDFSSPIDSCMKCRCCGSSTRCTIPPRCLRR